MAGVLCVPATYLRSLKSAAKLSAIATFAAVVMLICLLIRACVVLSSKGIGGGIPEDLIGEDKHIHLLPFSFHDFNTALPLLVITFCIQAGGSVILAALNFPQKSSDESQESYDQNKWIYD